MKQLFYVIVFISHPILARATQTHGEPEGLYVHQMAHLFFMFSMGLLIYWLRRRRLVAFKGWLSIQYGALFFILWNLNTVISHWIEEQSTLLRIHRVNGMQLELITNESARWLAVVYYITKLDHLLCVPALVFLFVGLRRLLKEPLTAAEREDIVP